MNLPSLSFIGYAIRETKRIIRLTRKPKQTEYTETARITGLGIIIIGFAGFLIFLAFTILRGR